MKILGKSYKIKRSDNTKSPFKLPRTEIILAQTLGGIILMQLILFFIKFFYCSVNIGFWFNLLGLALSFAGSLWLASISSLPPPLASPEERPPGLILLCLGFGLQIIGIVISAIDL